MSAITDARAVLADAVTGAGIECQPYAPDSLNPPGAFVDSISVDYASGSGFSFCATGTASAQIITAAQRHDRAAGLQWLEDLAPEVLRRLEAIPGVRVLSAESGTVEVGTQTVPAVLYTVQFSTSEGGP